MKPNTPARIAALPIFTSIAVLATAIYWLIRFPALALQRLRRERRDERERFERSSHVDLSGPEYEQLYAEYDRRRSLELADDGSGIGP